ncbi:MAG: 2,3-bisphosphoglycerate-independent phosphoglycerate mutase [Proteobacteria bacterium]|nr:2,3-bisphosphoglycerate-independent phosphoglycerate mutase [Pseudomonadota bacterium]MCL2307280.1 2,3-bisphosphoglycerate-independent phosphoglycerate mutase [Pseudomonadota bacterium]
MTTSTPLSPRPVALMILDGFGVRDDAPDNAVTRARMPFWRGLLARCPHTTLQTSAFRVGLPEGQMGNSEVGHLNIGAGRVVWQELTRVDQALEACARNEPNELTDSAAFRTAMDAARRPGATLHLFGLLSPGGVHSHETHLQAFIRLAAAQGASRIAMHAFLDGRDTPPQSAAASLAAMQAVCDEVSQTSSAQAHIVSLCGRYYAMDRDKRWERTEQAYRLLTEGLAEYDCDDVQAGLAAAYARGETDEFVRPTKVQPTRAQALLPLPPCGGGRHEGAGEGAEANPRPSSTGTPFEKGAEHGTPAQGNAHNGTNNMDGRIRDGDVVVFLNFRADRARQLTQAFTDPAFNGFPRKVMPKLAAYVTLTSYGEAFASLPVMFPPQPIEQPLGAYIAQLGLKQLRIAETEKYAHVTYFFNGGVETVSPGEDRILVPSPKVATYDLQPEMSAVEVTDRLVEAIDSGQYDLIVVNYANGDMVGHTGDFDAAVTAVETLDACLARVIAALERAGGEALITADHGNAEMMFDPATGQPHTAHTLNPVPLVYVGRPARLTDGGALCDLAPTVLQLMGRPVPAEMTGQSLVTFANKMA